MDSIFCSQDIFDNLDLSLKSENGMTEDMAIFAYQDFCHPVFTFVHFWVVNLELSG